jgi:hypothetical protein
MNVVNLAAEVAPKLSFNPQNFISNLKYMGIGMLVIFVVIGIIIGATMLINYLFSDNDKK